MTSPPGAGTGAETSNELSGTVGGSAVQARTIQGGVHFHAAPAAPWPWIPRQLPPRPAYFTDRSGPLTVLAEAAAGAGPGSLPVVVLAGAGGTGKTALAVHALHEAAGAFPGGQLYAALGGFSPGGRVRPQAVIARWLRALGISPPAVPADPEEAAALFRSVTAARPVAVLADDAADAGQVRALPGAGLVVVTSRHQLESLAAREGACLVRLGPMDTEAAGELAGRIIARPGTGPDVLAGLAASCGRLPLAIRVAAARLAARPHLQIEQLTSELTATRHRLPLLDTPDITDQEGFVTAVMATSYDDLHPDTARAYRLLSLHTGPDFTTQAGAALLDTSTGTAGQLITVLAEASLLTETAPDRWGYHDLTREHARETARLLDPAADQEAAVGRVIEYYLRASAAADLLVLPGRWRTAPAFGLPRLNRPAYTSTADALAWADTEQASLLQAQATAARYSMHTLAWQFCDTLWGFVGHRHDYPAWQQVCQTAAESARACGDPRAEVFALVRLASCHLSRGQVQAAADVAGQAIGTAWASGDRAGEASARESAAICALETGDYQDAIYHSTRGLHCWRAITSHARGEALLERMLGRAYAGLGDSRQADDHFETALAIFERLEERYHTARTLYGIAETRLAAGPGAANAAEAIMLLGRARPLMEAEDHPLSLSEILTVLGEAHARTGNSSQAGLALAQATALHDQACLAAAHPARTRASALARTLAAAGTAGPDEPAGGRQDG
jgi:tetratricopeptide (TPR) repeat protein